MTNRKYDMPYYIPLDKDNVTIAEYGILYKLFPFDPFDLSYSVLLKNTGDLAKISLKFNNDAKEFEWVLSRKYTLIHDELYGIFSMMDYYESIRHYTKRFNECKDKELLNTYICNVLDSGASLSLMHLLDIAVFISRFTDNKMLRDLLLTKMKEGERWQNEART